MASWGFVPSCFAFAFWRLGLGHRATAWAGKSKCSSPQSLPTSPPGRQQDIPKPAKTCASGSPPGLGFPKQLPRETSRRYPDQMPGPPQLTPLCCCSSTLRGVSCGSLGIWSGCLLDISLGRYFGHAHSGGDSRADQEHAGEIVSPRFTQVDQ